MKVWLTWGVDTHPQRFFAGKRSRKRWFVRVGALVCSVKWL